MPGDAPRKINEPKLRSSCDACGSAKLRCDRGQPDCGRCLAYGIPCFYGMSRRVGKPPRGRRPSLAPSLPLPNRQASENDAENHNTGGHVIAVAVGGGGPPINTVPFTAADASAGHEVTHYATENIAPLDIDSLDQLWPSLTNATPFNPSESVIPDGHDGNGSSGLQFGSTFSLSSPDLTSSGVPAMQPPGYQYRPNPSSQPGSKHHDCPRETYEILGSLLFPDHNGDNNNNNNNSSHIPPAQSATAPTTDVDAGGVPLDRVLRLNREAIEGLAVLMACSCARSPKLALLHASSIAQIMNWYHQVAVTSQGASRVAVPSVLETASRRMSTPRPSPDSMSTDGSAYASSVWSSTTSGRFGTRSTNTPSSSTERVTTELNVALGTFSVDDQQIQTALKLQLLLGEMRQVGHLIDQFVRSHNLGGQRLAGDDNSSSVDNLYQDVDSWLKGEHLRIANTMRSRLRELNA